VTELETNVYLCEILGPLEHWSRVMVLLSRHLQLLQNPLIRLQPFIDNPDYSLIIELVVVVQLPEAIKRLSYEI